MLVCHVVVEFVVLMYCVCCYCSCSVKEGCRRIFPFSSFICGSFHVVILFWSEGSKEKISSIIFGDSTGLGSFEARSTWQANLQTPSLEYSEFFPLPYLKVWGCHIISQVS